MTTCVWNRHILTEEYGADISKIARVVDVEEHVQALKLPPNVIQAPVMLKERPGAQPGCTAISYHFR